MSWTAKLLNYLDRRSKASLWGSVAVLLLILGLTDYFTGTQLIISTFYLLPIALASWSLGQKPGIVVSFLSAIVLQGTNILAGEQLSSPLIALWNTAIRLGTFLLVATLLSQLHVLLQHHTELSRIDALTGILNRRAFYEAAEAEIKKIERHARPLTVVFMDVDNFKSVNDASGHAAGDALLIRVTKHMQNQLRGSDSISRLGGDEYGLLLPETSEEAAHTVIFRMQRGLLEDMAEAKWPVTFSIGVLTCSSAPPDVEYIVNLADQLMYTAKRCGKNRIEYSSYPARPEESQPSVSQESAG